MNPSNQRNGVVLHPAAETLADKKCVAYLYDKLFL